MSARVIVVDDEVALRKSLATGLRLEGFEVLEAEDGGSALATLSACSADFAIVDLMMPGMNGLDLARRLRLLHPNLRVVITSGYHVTERQLERADVGAIAFVPKPYTLDELAGFLRSKMHLS